MMRLSLIPALSHQRLKNKHANLSENGAKSALMPKSLSQGAPRKLTQPHGQICQKLILWLAIMTSLKQPAGNHLKQGMLSPVHVSDVMTIRETASHFVDEFDDHTRAFCRFSKGAIIVAPSASSPMAEGHHDLLVSVP